MNNYYGVERNLILAGRKHTTIMMSSISKKEAEEYIQKQIESLQSSDVNKTIQFTLYSRLPEDNYCVKEIKTYTLNDMN